MMSGTQLKSYIFGLIPVRLEVSYKTMLKITKAATPCIVEDGRGGIYFTNDPRDTDTVLYYLEWHSYGGKDVN